MNNWESSFDPRIDEYVDAFESAWQAGIAENLEAFLPPPDHPSYAEIVVELARIDLERRWGAPDGRGRTAEDYFNLFPDVFGAPDWRSVLAYEEFRLRRLSGESIAPNQFASRYGVETEGWPEVPVGKREPSTVRAESGWLAEVSQWEFRSQQKLAAARKRLPNVGEEFLGFELVGILGEGALGRVYLARQGDLSHRFVALKVAVQPTDEPQRLAQLQHTNIVPIFSLHRAGPLQATCMPFLGANTLADVLGQWRDDEVRPRSGEDLVSTLVARDSETVIGAATRHETGQRRPRARSLELLRSMSYPQTVLWLGERITRALACAHDRGVVHCDLKPANIVLTDDGEPLLVDFHLAAEYGEGAATSYVVGGTLPYMAPEHLRAIQHGGRVAPTADVYSVGVLLFEMLTGQLPFPSRSGPFDDVVEDLVRDRNDLSSVRERLSAVASPACTAIILKCLDPDPSRRFPTATELHEDLRRQLDHRPLRHTVEPSWRERLVKWSRRHPYVSSTSTLATVALLLLLLLAVGWRSTRRQLARRDAEMALLQLSEAVSTSEAALTAPESELRHWKETARWLDQVLAPYHLRQYPETWRDSPLVQALPPNRRDELTRNVGRALLLLAVSQARLAQRDPKPERRQAYWNTVRELSPLVKELAAKDPSATALLEKLNRLAAGLPPAQPAGLPVAEDGDRYLLALRLIEQGEPSRAARQLEVLTMRQPRRWNAWFGLGSCYYSLGRFRDAEAAYTTAVALFPEGTIAYAYRGAARLKLERWGAAIEDFHTVLDRDVRRHDAWVNLGIAQMARGDTTKAVASFDQALKYNPQYVRAYLLRARAKQRLGDMAAAEADRKRAFQYHPRDPLSYVARGVAIIAQDPEAALADFQAALQLDPNSTTALQDAASALAERLHRNEEAIPFLDRLVRLRPDDPGSLASRGVLLARLGRRDEAVRDARQALLKKPTPLQTLQIACIYSLTSRIHPSDRQQAIQLVRRALAQRPLLASLARNDTDLAPIAKDPEFRRLIDSAGELISPKTK